MTKHKLKNPKVLITAWSFVASSLLIFNAPSVRANNIETSNPADTSNSYDSYTRAIANKDFNYIVQRYQSVIELIRDNPSQVDTLTMGYLSLNSFYTERGAYEQADQVNQEFFTLFEQGRLVDWSTYLLGIRQQLSAYRQKDDSLAAINFLELKRPIIEKAIQQTQNFEKQVSLLEDYALLMSYFVQWLTPCNSNSIFKGSATVEQAKPEALNAQKDWMRGLSQINQIATKNQTSIATKKHADTVKANYKFIQRVFNDIQTDINWQERLVSLGTSTCPNLSHDNAIAQIDQNQPENAIKEYQKQIQQFTHQPEKQARPLFLLALSYERRGNTGQAEKLYNRAIEASKHLSYQVEYDISTADRAISAAKGQIASATSVPRKSIIKQHPLAELINNLYPQFNFPSAGVAQHFIQSLSDEQLLQSGLVKQKIQMLMAQNKIEEARHLLDAALKSSDFVQNPRLALAIGILNVEWLEKYKSTSEAMQAYSTLWSSFMDSEQSKLLIDNTFSTYIAWLAQRGLVEQAEQNVEKWGSKLTFHFNSVREELLIHFSRMYGKSGRTEPLKDAHAFLNKALPW